MTRSLSIGSIAIVLCCGSGCSSPPPGSGGAAPPPSATPNASPVALKLSINAVMVSLVDHAAHNLWEVEREGQAPKTDGDWDRVVEHAEQIVAAAPAITSGGTGPTDAIWAKSPAWVSHAQRMADAGLAALNAARARNLDALIAANGTLVEACEGCHKEFKPALPTEGIVHDHPK